ncbi:hypothetical protein FJ423_21670 [Mesorhizobium sp. B2-8-9]|nr:hypothetical protein FJ423_21670 [Mesorhizobium sp. B2-8-9]
MIRAGARVVYAGNLDPKGLTFNIFRCLTGAYAAAQEAAFIHIVPEPILRGTSFDGLVVALREGMAVVETRIHVEDSLLPIRAIVDGLLIGKGGSRIKLGNDAEFKSWLDARQSLDNAPAYSAARKAMTEVSDARVVLGGKMGLTNSPATPIRGPCRALWKAGMPCGGTGMDRVVRLVKPKPMLGEPIGEPLGEPP